MIYVLCMNKIQIKKCYPYCLPNFKECSYTHKLKMEDMLITDILSLKNLINLKYLNLGSNQISDISPLKNLMNLGTLFLWRNQISDISPLVNLINLKNLHIGCNPINDLSLREFVQLEGLGLEGLCIKDISILKDMVNLRELHLWHNPMIDNISVLEKLNKLESLYINKYQMSQKQFGELKKALPNCQITTD